MKNRKFLLMGIIMFCLVAIVTTTFATFVITGGDKDLDVTGPTIDVTEVENEFATVTANLNAANNTVLVDANPVDQNGPIIHGGEDEEDLNFALDITVTGEEAAWTGVKVTVTFTAGNTYGENKTLFAPVDEITLDQGDFTKGDSGNVYTLTTPELITLAYGTATDGKNPATYYNGQEISDYSQLETDLNNLLTAYKGVKINVKVEVQTPTA